MAISSPVTESAPRRPGWLVPLLVAVVLVLVAATAVTTWALTRTSSAAPTAVDSPSPSVAAATTAQGPEDAACAAAESLRKTDDAAARTAGAQRIAELGKQSADTDFRIQAQLVSDIADLAEAAGPGDLATQKSLWDAVLRFRDLCDEQ